MRLRHKTAVVVEDGCSGETLRTPCARKKRPGKRLQRKVTTDYQWIGAEEIIGMFSKS